MQCAGCGVELVGTAACPGCGMAIPTDQPIVAGRLRPPTLPDERWTLTAPESLALRYVSGGIDGLGAFKLALIELITRAALRLHAARLDRRLLPGTLGVWLLSDGERLASVTEPALTPVVDAYVRARRRHGVTHGGLTVEGVLITELVRSATRRDAGLRRYLKHTVAGQLKRRGLISGRDKHEYTEAGARADELLGRWLELGKGPFMRRHGSDLQWASAYLAGAGAAVLLIDDAYPALARFSAAARAGSIDGGVAQTRAARRWREAASAGLSTPSPASTTRSRSLTPASRASAATGAAAEMAAAGADPQELHREPRAV